jgi:tetratricopeptide (TPR) repeat protein
VWSSCARVVPRVDDSTTFHVHHRDAADPGLAAIERREDDPPVSRNRGVELFLRLGEHAPAGGRLSFLAHYAQPDGDFERARSLYEQGAEQYRLAGDNSGVWVCIHSLGDIALEQGDLTEAFVRFREAQPFILSAGTAYELAAAVGGIAAVAAAGTHTSEAGRLWGAFERLATETERRFEPHDRQIYERALGRLDDQDVDLGRTLSDDEVRELLQETTRALSRRARLGGRRGA